MSLSNIISQLDLTVYPEIGLIIFLSVFVIVSARVIRTPRTTATTRALLPLEENDLDERETTP